MCIANLVSGIDFSEVSSFLFSFQLGILNSRGINERFSFILLNVFMFLRNHSVSTNGITPPLPKETSNNSQLLTLTKSYRSKRVIFSQW